MESLCETITTSCYCNVFDMSILIGENNTNEQKTYIKKCKYSYDFFTVIYIVLGFLFINSLMKILGTSGDGLLYGISYF